MNLSYQNQRVAILIDTANMYHTTKHLYSGRMQFSTLCSDAVLNRCLVRAIAYGVTTEGGEEKQFMDSLRTLGIEVKTKDLIIYKSGDKKADWDVGIAIDAVSLTDHIDVLVLVSGDGDFVPMVRYMQSRGVQVEVMSFEQSTSQMLIDACDVFVNLSADVARYVFTNTVTRRSAVVSRKTSTVPETTPGSSSVSRETVLHRNSSQGQIVQSLQLPTQKQSAVNQTKHANQTAKQQNSNQKNQPTLESNKKQTEPKANAQSTETVKPKSKKRFYPRKNTSK